LYLPAPTTTSQHGHYLWRAPTRLLGLELAGSTNDIFCVSFDRDRNHLLVEVEDLSQLIGRVGVTSSTRCGN
jgi:hypothetical protein